MDEVLMRHRQMKPQLEKRYHPSHADDPENQNFDRQLLDKITNLKRDRDREVEHEVGALSEKSFSSSSFFIGGILSSGNIFDRKCLFFVADFFTIHIDLNIG